MEMEKRLQMRVGFLLAMAVMACGAQGEAIALESGLPPNRDGSLLLSPGAGSDSEKDDLLLGESESILDIRGGAAPTDQAELECKRISFHCRHCQFDRSRALVVPDSMFKGVAGGTMADQAPHYVRHMGDSAMMTTASSDDDKRDTTWRVKPLG